MYFSEDRRCSRLPTHITAKQYGIECPEKGQGYGNRTKLATSALVFGKEVTLQTHGLDKNRRTLADVILPDGTNVNYALVKAGWWYRKYATGNTALEELEKDTREARKGLWSDLYPVPPLGMAEENPVCAVKLTKELRQRLRFLEAGEEAALLAECAEPLRTLVLIGTNCGLRLKSEALTLRWDDVDVVRRTLTVPAAYAKSGTSRTVSLNSTILAVLTRLPRISEFVFAKRNGKPYHAIRGFRAACERAGLTDVTPHSTRHTFATRLVENGVGLRTVQELGGWATLSLIQRYAHVAPSRKAEAVEGLVKNFTTDSTTPAIQRIGQPA